MNPTPPAPSRIEIPPFPAGHRIAVTTSWDDGVAEDRQLIASMNEWGLKGTFNLNSSKFTRTGHPEPARHNQWQHIDASEVPALYAGHEVAIHTATHPWLDKLDPSQIATEVLDDRKALEDLVNYPVRGMAYPFGAYNVKVIEILRALGIVYCRTVENKDPCFPPPEPLAWGATAHIFNKHPADIAQRFEQLYNNPKYSGVYFIWGHSYEFDRNDTWNSLEKLLKPLAGKPDVWYCTNIQLFDYESARQRLVLAANRRTAYNPSAIPVSLKVDDKLKEIPPGQTVKLD